MIFVISLFFFYSINNIYLFNINIIKKYILFYLQIENKILKDITPNC